PNLQRPLDVDFQQHVPPRRQLVEGGVFGRPVVLAVDLGVFQEGVLVEPFEELVPGNMVVLLLFVVPRALRAGGGRDGVDDVQELRESAGDRGLADAARAAENDEDAGLGGGRGHLARRSKEKESYSTFWTCSLSRSIAPLISTMCLAIWAS